MLFLFVSFAFNNFFIISVVREKIKVSVALAISAGAPTTLGNKIMQIPLLVTLKTIKILSMQLKAVTFLLNFLVHGFF